MVAVLSAAGFTDVQTLVEWSEVIYRDEEMWWAAQWSHGGRAVLEEIEAACDVDGLERFRIEVGEGVKEIKQSVGIHTMWLALFTRGKRPGSKR